MSCIRHQSHLIYTQGSIQALNVTCYEQIVLGDVTPLRCQFCQLKLHIKANKETE